MGGMTSGLGEAAAEAVGGAVSEAIHPGVHAHSPGAAVAEHLVGKPMEATGTESFKEREHGVVEFFTDKQKLANDKKVGLGLRVEPDKIKAASNRDPLQLSKSGASWEEQAAAVDGEMNRLRASQEYQGASPQEKIYARAQIYPHVKELYERAGREAPNQAEWLMNTMGGKIFGMELGLDAPELRGLTPTQANLMQAVGKGVGAWGYISMFGAALAKSQFLSTQGVIDVLSQPTKLKEEGVMKVLKDAWDKAGGDVINKWYRDSAQFANTTDFFLETHPRDGVMAKMSRLGGETIATLPLYTALEEAKLGQSALQPARRWAAKQMAESTQQAVIRGGIQTTETGVPSVTARLAQTLTGKAVEKRLNNAFVAVIGNMAQQGRITPRPEDAFAGLMGVGVGEVLGGVKWAGQKTGATATIGDALSSTNDWLRYVAGDIATGRKPITLDLADRGPRPETGLARIATTGASPPPRTTGVPPPGKPLEGEYEPEGGFPAREAPPQYMSQEEYEAATRGRAQPTPTEGRPGAIVTPPPAAPAGQLERGPIYGEAGEPTPGQKLLEGRVAKPEAGEPAREGPLVTPAPEQPAGLLERGPIWLGPGGSTGESTHGSNLGEITTGTEHAANAEPEKPATRDVSNIPTMSMSAIEQWSAEHLAMGGEPFSTGIISSAWAELTGQASLSAEQLVNRATNDPVMEMMHKGEMVALQSLALKRYGKSLQALAEPAQKQILMDRFKLARTASFKLPALLPDLTLEEVTKGIQEQAAKNPYFKQALEQLRAAGVDVPQVVAAKKVADVKSQMGMTSERNVTEGIGDIPPTKKGATPDVVGKTLQRMDTMLESWRKKSPTIAKNFEGFIQELRELDGNKIEFQDDAHRLLFHYLHVKSEEVQRKIKDYLKDIIPGHNMLSAIMKPGDKTVTQEHMKILRANLMDEITRLEKSGRIKDGKARIYRQTDLVSPSKYSSAELTSIDTEQMAATETMVKNSKGGTQTLGAVRAVGNGHSPPVNPEAAKVHDKVIDSTFKPEIVGKEE